ncbi:hypothetical protein H2200_012253 [Cladophialophora chaetospira]|uniref:Suppressor protein SRP40 n=1 Tax=Cladophialophora chaetospira TaxID=386627 RepID=A0AA38WYG6_9EURO|nr:hypothetical protein H2200_012253 [Cladophialophora chaetospira]
MLSGSMRLHITPLNPDLFKAVVGPHLLDSVSNISYHTIQTFPENSYGYLELPTMEGEKLKKKLNGAILKGKKVKVEEARPKKRRRVAESEEVVLAQDLKAPSATRAKISKKDRNVVLGQELPLDRKVKRGWTEAKSSKSGKKEKSKTAPVKSKYTAKDELLFRTKLPPNKQIVAATPKEKAKSKKQKKGDHTVHEFEKSTTQPSFLKQEVGLGINADLKYVDGQGWVDEAGQVVEKEHEGVTKKREATIPRLRTKRKREKQTDEATSPFDENEDVSKRSDGDDDEETSSSGSSSASQSDQEIDDKLSSSPRSDGGQINDQTELHPLEALFKKPSKPASQDIAKPSLEISTSFSFFDEENADDLEEEPIIPLTPFSSQEFRSRGLRSAAPTPDTAHPSRFNSYGSSGLPGDEEMEEEESVQWDNVPSKKQPPETASRTTSEFEKKFWENRAENNRAWKLRRRTVLKEKRQRENKARRPKNW